jgi:hypothetical protein
MNIKKFIHPGNLAPKIHATLTSAEMFLPPMVGRKRDEKCRAYWSTL